MDYETGVTRLPAPLPPTLEQRMEPYAEYCAQRAPLIVDNGSTNLRWGFAGFGSPFEGLNAVAKYKERRTNKPLLLFGEAIDVESGAKAQTRTAWEGDVLLNFDALVCSVHIAI